MYLIDDFLHDIYFVYTILQNIKFGEFIFDIQNFNPNSINKLFF